MAFDRIRKLELSAGLYFIAGILLGASLTLLGREFQYFSRTQMLWFFGGAIILANIIFMAATLFQKLSLQEGEGRWHDGMEDNTKKAGQETHNPSLLVKQRFPETLSQAPADDIEQNKPIFSKSSQRSVSHRSSSNAPSTASLPYAEDDNQADRKPLHYSSPNELPPDFLIEVWGSFYRESDGHFTAPRLEKQLVQMGVRGKVIPGSELGAPGLLLGVVLENRKDTVYILPNFNKSPKALMEWFDDRGSGSLAAQINRVDELAVGHKDANGQYRIDARGIIG